MTDNLSSEEVEAILDPPGEAKVVAVQVAPRDFHQPRRLSQAQRDSIHTRLGLAMPTIEAKVRAWLRAPHDLAATDVGEIATQGLFDDLEEPFLVIAFSVGGAQGWVRWDNLAALASIEVALGNQDVGEIEARPLSPLEQGVVKDFLWSIVTGIAHTLGLEPEDPEVLQDARGFLLSLDPDLASDPQRLYVHLDFAGPGEESAIRIYLPGVLPDGARHAPDQAKITTVPRHLDEVPLEFCARLGSAEVPLRDVLGLEPGDVIPLDIDASSPLRLWVDERDCGSAHWGSHQGRLAISILELDPNTEEY